MTVADEPVQSLIQRPALLVHLDDTLRQVAETFETESVGAAVVKGTHPIGLVSERDVLNALAGGADPATTRVSEIMTDDVAVAAPNDRVLDVTRRMLDNEIRHVPVVEDDVVIGVVSVRDVLRAFADAAGAG